MPNLPRIAVIGTGGTISSLGNGSLDVLDYPDFGQKLTSEELLEKYHIQSTLLPTEAAANSLLDRLPGWSRLYRDDIAVVHVRTQQVASRQ